MFEDIELHVLALRTELSIEWEEYAIATDSLHRDQDIEMPRMRSAVMQRHSLRGPYCLQDSTAQRELCT